MIAFLTDASRFDYQTKVLVIIAVWLSNLQGLSPTAFFSVDSFALFQITQQTPEEGII